MWIDSHCHVPYEGVGLEVIADAQAAGVGRMITVGTDAEQSLAAVETAAAHDGVWATVGLHPHDAKNGVDTVTGLFDRPKVVAVGECGLDYYYEHSPRETQRDVFAAQIALAHERNLALVVHTRDAWDDTIDILRSEKPPPRTIIHCFTGGADEARRCLDLGAVLSFSGIITFKTANDIRAAADLCPIERLLVETDSPYLTPVPHRGKRNAPAFVPLVGAAVAAVKNVPVERVEHATWENAEAIFGLRPDRHAA